MASCTNDVKIHVSGYSLVSSLNTNIFATVLTTAAESSPAVLQTNRRALKNLRLSLKNVFAL